MEKLKRIPDKKREFSEDDLITNLKAFHLDMVDGDYSKELLEKCNKWINKNIL